MLRRRKLDLKDGGTIGIQRTPNRILQELRNTLKLEYVISFIRVQVLLSWRISLMLVSPFILKQSQRILV